MFQNRGPSILNFIGWLVLTQKILYTNLTLTRQTAYIVIIQYLIIRKTSQKTNAYILHFHAYSIIHGYIKWTILLFKTTTIILNVIILKNKHENAKFRLLFLE